MMAPKSSRNSHVSIVSVDPAIASQITTAKSPLQLSHTRTESTPIKSPSAATGLAYVKSHGRTNSAPNKNHKRSNSLRKAKNSTEMLRQRSSKKEKHDSGDYSNDSKRGRNFTVTNVGTGGTLYLRPSTQRRPMSPALSPSPPTPWTAPATTLVMPQDNEAVLLSTQHNPLGRGPTVRTRSVSPKRLMERINKSKEVQSIASRPTHGRSQSFSTVDESRRSISASLPKTLKIVINRPDQVRPATSEADKPTLQIPIPHYRLGNPRFSSNGTPMLRSSTFTHTSSAPSTRHASTIRGDVPLSAPPPSSMKAFAKLQNQGSAPSVPAPTDGYVLPKSNDLPVRASGQSSIGAAPSIYDDLSGIYNDPSVVRFAHDIREVTAATPARIIAQISSESFMDYELVSDFFLTFRSYMSTVDVLDLLLARLKWAIGRMTDDGRIIRIRTFAALRHWILNYFMDDFVSHRHIRERFCDEVNDMYDDVLNRYMGVQSDLKILQDLKRCWNGRCALYWDGEEFDMDGDPDNEIFPGGVLGSRNPDYVSAEEVRPPVGRSILQSYQQVTNQMPPPSSPTQSRTAQSHRPKPSFATSGAAESVQSEQSIQPRSCSALLSSSRHGNEIWRPAKGPVPVSVLSRRQNAPNELTVATNLTNNQKPGHRRGGNSIDTTRERTPVQIPQSAVLYPEIHEGSVIRGFVYGPVEPFVQLPASLPQSPSGRFDLTVTSPSITRIQNEHTLNAGGPAVKNIFGSIRRALSGKPGTSEVALITVSTQTNYMLGGRKSPMPLNISRSQDELRRKAAGVTPSKAMIRIDLLCAAAMESYQAAQNTSRHLPQSEPRIDILNSDTLFPPPPIHRPLGEPDGKPARVPSHDSAESGSILIVNDTDSEMPVMSGAIQAPARNVSQRTRSSAEHYLPNDHTSFETQIAFQDESRHEEVQAKLEHVDAEAAREAGYQASSARPDRLLSSPASSTTMRHRRSLSSSVAHNRTLTSPGPTVSAATPPQDYRDEASMSSPKPPGHLLRRRPGGDLRKNQNVHELEPLNTQHESGISTAGTFSTMADSVLVMESAAQAQQLFMRKAEKVSMINTHSSQHLRPSFEAAVAGFSTIPDDNDGGLEATLLKLEGKYEKSPELIGYSPDLESDNRYSEDRASFQPLTDIPSSSPVPDRAYIRHIVPESPAQSHQPIEVDNSYTLDVHHDTIMMPQYASRHPGLGLQIQSIARSEVSTDSVPLLKRDIDDLHLAGSAVQTPVAPDRNLQPGHSKSDSNEANLLRGPSPGSNLTPDNSNTYSERSLLDEDDRSDLSSEISVDIINYSEAMGGINSPLLVAPGTAVSGLEIPSHPLAHSSFVNISLHPSLALDSKSVQNNDPKSSEPILLKIGNADSTVVRGDSRSKGRVESQRGGKISAGPAHLPFVLACDSQMLAQQLTIVEQAALTEIEWSDLVEMRWTTTASSVLDWAEYVAHHNVNGIDLVITRFNLMVKWAVSEIVLTQDIDERVRVITKLIHVAAHARRLHNYATMLQLTIALTSTDCTRMSKTWDLVPGPDKSLLKNMESLIQPVRNFHDLRLEMESADLSGGCVPFIGLYIHDLTYNAQKPVEVEIGKGQPPLINFERFRTAAVIVKGLLRLIDASSRYEFEPIHGVFEKCLWIAALPDERIRSLSRSLQG